MQAGLPPRLDAGWRPTAVAVCIPVRNEEAELPATLDALARLDAESRLDVAFCFLLDGCTDRSADILTDFARRSANSVVIEAVPDRGASNAGIARGRAMALGQRVLGDTRRAALLTTDADTRPAGDWIGKTCQALALCDVVAGRILRESPGDQPVQTRLEDYFDRLHALRRAHDPVDWEARPAHHHVGGASLAFRADAYAALGGFDPVPNAEDAAIVDAAHRAGLRVRRDRDVLVRTSSRREGRALRGFADHLRALSPDADQILVSDPSQAAWQYRGHALARMHYGALENPEALQELAVRLNVDMDHIRRVAQHARNAEAFVTHVVPSPPGPDRKLTLPAAERALGQLEPIGHPCAA